ncbi:MAG: hypothetical protein RLZZ234_802 [Candidatus Parcubacteria bacterium]|jgi:RNA polymerase sigma-70 factor (ECF subfamily)
MKDDHDIRELVLSSIAGSTVSFKALYELLIDRVYGYLRVRTSREEDATDIAQDAFVELYKSLPTFAYRSRDEFFAYVFVIVRRTLARHYANKHTKQRHITDSFDDSSVASPQEHVEIAHDVMRALSTLDETSREIVILHHYGRNTFPEIAKILGMQESAVRVRHHRALKTLLTFFTRLT